jgi:hypothetical protein
MPPAAQAILIVGLGVTHSARNAVLTAMGVAFGRHRTLAVLLKVPLLFVGFLRNLCARSHVIGIAIAPSARLGRCSTRTRGAVAVWLTSYSI